MMQKQEKTPSMTGIQGAFEEGKNERSSETQLWRQMTLLVVPFSEVKLTFGSEADRFWDAIFSLNFLKVPGKENMHLQNHSMKR